MGCGFSRFMKEGEGGPGVGALAPVDVWEGEDVHVDVAGRGRKRLPQGIAVPPSVHKASFQRAVRKIMDNLWQPEGFVFKNDKYPPSTPAPTGGGGGGPASSPGSLVPAGMDVRHTGSPPKGVGWQKFPRQGGESVGGTGAGAVEAMEKHDTPKSPHKEHDPRGKAPKRTKLEAKRLELIRSFERRKDILLEDLQEDFGGAVRDIRLLGSVLDSKRFREDSDVDVAVIIADAPRARPWVVKLHKALFGGGYPFHLRYQGKPFALDPITMSEEDWEAWSRGKTKTERGLSKSCEECYT